MLLTVKHFLSSLLEDDVKEIRCEGLRKVKAEIGIVRSLFSIPDFLPQY